MRGGGGGVCVCVIITLARAEEEGLLGIGTLFFFFFCFFNFFGRVTLFMVGLSCRPQVQKAHTLLSIPPHALGADWHVGRGYSS